VARLDFGGAHHGARARLDISGAGCSRVRSWVELRAWVEALAECKLTRVDLAVDALEGEFSVEDAVQWYQGGEFNAGGRMPRHSLVGDWLCPRHGRTLEVGRRENGKMLRCYEKGRQLGDQGSPWTRFEVELRNNDRDLPFEILTDRDKYFTGAYRCLERILAAAGERIRTHQKEGEISLDRLTGFARSAYGQLIHVLRGKFSAGEVIDAISRPGYPKRLERAALGGFSISGPPPLLS
jgi:phage replication initiation protein